MRSGTKGGKGKSWIDQGDKIIVANLELELNLGNNSGEDVGDAVVPANRLSKSTSQLPDPSTSSPTSSTSPVKIRRLSSRKSQTTERYKRIFILS